MVQYTYDGSERMPIHAKAINRPEFLQWCELRLSLDNHYVY